jgi:hypothetical protein
MASGESGAGDIDKGSHRATIRWRGSRELAEVLLAAVSPDDPDAFEARIEECGDSQGDLSVDSDGDSAADSDGEAVSCDEVELVIETASDSVGSVRATLDDLLSCLAAVESAIQAIDDGK